MGFFVCLLLCGLTQVAIVYASVVSLCGDSAFNFCEPEPYRSPPPPETPTERSERMADMDS